ncbi:MAG: extracellular solute-binding protein [Pseudomonadota bacterium]
MNWKIHPMSVALAATTATSVGITQPAFATSGEPAELTRAHGISAFGELKYPPDFSHFDYVNPDAPKGGTLSFRGQGASRTFDSLNPYILAGEPAQGIERIYDSLLVPAFDEPSAAYGQIAESLEFPEDRSFVIFNMRPEARFSDGEPITAEDVVWTLNTLKTEGHPRFRIAVQGVESAEALGPHRVRVNFAEDVPTRDLPSEIGQLPVLPQHYYENVAFNRSTLEPPVGSGAYVIDRVDPGRSIRYCVQPDYWGADLAVNVGHDNFECVVYEYFADNTAAFEALKSGTYLFHEEMTSALWATGYDFPAIRNEWIERKVLEDGRPSGAQGFYMNMRRPQMQDPLVREAISLLFNFEWSNDTLFHGLYNRTDSFFENFTMEAEGLPEGAELAYLEQFRDRLPETVFTKPAYSPPENGSQQTDRRALRAASALLDEAGWEVGDDGMRRNAEGNVLSIEFVADSPAFSRIVLPYIDNLKRVGIDARYVQVDPAQMQQRQEDFDYDMTIARLVPTATPSGELRAFFSSEAAEAPGTYNLAGLSDPVVDEMIEQVIAAETRDEMEIRARALDRVLRDRHIWVPNWHKGEHWLAVWDVFGRPEIKPPFDRGDRTWWFDQAQYDALLEQGALRP